MKAVVKFRIWFFVVVLLVGVSSSYGDLFYATGYLSSPAGSGLVSGGEAWTSPPGFRVIWTVTQLNWSTWHYRYEFRNESGGPLSMLVSHMIIPLSENFTEEDLFNPGLDVGDTEIGTFALSTSNPGFPVGESLFGVKIDMAGEQLVAEFDSTRQPMWGDFYAKDGGEPKNYAYSSDFGVEVANLHDYAGVPVDGDGEVLNKILVPDTVPEPVTMALLGLGAAAIVRRRK